MRILCRVLFSNAVKFLKDIFSNSAGLRIVIYFALTNDIQYKSECEIMRDDKVGV